MAILCWLLMLIKNTQTLWIPLLDTYIFYYNIVILPIYAIDIEYNLYLTTVI